jgi:NAD(P)-dependent dehydrogenase (short-subunit alcohol dehydrogenase family)
MFDFNHKVVLITGAAQGFGKVCALAFADRGAKLSLCDINDERGQETLREIQTRQPDCLYVHADVSKEGDVKKLIEATIAQFGRLDVAVNNAAKEIAGPTLDLPSSAFDDSSIPILRAFITA